MVGPIVVSRQNLAGQPSVVADRALSVQQSTLPTWIGIDLGSNGYRGVEVIKVMDANPVTRDTDQQRVGQYAQQWSTAEALAYYEVLKRRFKVQYKVQLPT